MLDGHLFVDAHVHVPVLGSLKQAWIDWARDFGPDGILEDLWDAEGVPRPARLDELFEEQGVDHALLFSEYSPRVTGIQRFEDVLAIVEHNPARFRPVANVNPHLHFPIADEVRRQLDLGAAALKLHPVHGGFRCDDAGLYPAYQVLAERGVPLIVHCGTSTFPGSMNELADPAYLLPVVRDFPTVDVVLAHGGRGWWYDAAAFMALANPNVWIELSGLPPKRLPELLPPPRHRAAGAPLDLRDRLARRPGHRAERPRRRRARTVRRGGRRGARWQRRPRLPRAEQQGAVMTDDVPTGRPAAELSDEELESQGKQLHDSRNWVFLHGSAAQFETHTHRMLELEQEYLRRFPKRTWQGSEDSGESEDTGAATPVDDPVAAVLQAVADAGGRMHKLEVHQLARRFGLPRAELAGLYKNDPKLLATEKQDRVITDAGRERLAPGSERSRSVERRTGEAWDER